MNDRLEGVRQTLDLLPQLLHVGLLVGHQLLEVERNDGVQHRQHLVCSEDIDRFHQLKSEVVLQEVSVAMLIKTLYDNAMFSIDALLKAKKVFV